MDEEYLARKVCKDNIDGKRRFDKPCILWGDSVSQDATNILRVTNFNLQLHQAQTGHQLSTLCH